LDATSISTIRPYLKTTVKHKCFALCSLHYDCSSSCGPPETDWLTARKLPMSALLRCCWDVLGTVRVTSSFLQYFIRKHCARTGRVCAVWKICKAQIVFRTSAVEDFKPLYCSTAVTFIGFSISRIFCKPISASRKTNRIIRHSTEAYRHTKSTR